MGKHQRSAAKNRTWASAVTAGLALEVVSLFGFTYATSSHIAGVNLMASTIFVDGTRDIIPTNDNQGRYRMRDALSGTVDGVPGAFDQCPPEQLCADNVFVSYPRSMGILTGIHDMAFDDSKAQATQAIKNAIRDNPSGGPIYVVGYSQGAQAAAEALSQLEHENATNPEDAPDVNLSDVTFVLLGNPLRNDGGVSARFPRGIYVPLLGMTLGGQTNSTTATVIQINKQYDWISDAPKYVLNPLAWANSMMGFLYVHNGYYDDFTIPDLTGDGIVDEEDYDYLADHPDALDNNENYIVTVSENGKVVDVLLKNPVGQLPLTRPLLDLGVPPEVVKALDPLLRAIIETGYDRPTDGKYPSEPVLVGLAPGPSQWLTDIHSIAAGFHETAAALAALGHPDPEPQPENAIQVSHEESHSEVQGSTPHLGGGFAARQQVQTQQARPELQSPTGATLESPTTGSTRHFPTFQPGQLSQHFGIGSGPTIKSRLFPRGHRQASEDRNSTEESEPLDGVGTSEEDIAGPGDSGNANDPGPGDADPGGGSNNDGAGAGNNGESGNTG